MPKFTMRLYASTHQEVEADDIEQAEQKFLEMICNEMDIDEVDAEEGDDE